MFAFQDHSLGSSHLTVLIVPMLCPLTAPQPPRGVSSPHALVIAPKLPVPLVLLRYEWDADWQAESLSCMFSSATPSPLVLSHKRWWSQAQR